MIVFLGFVILIFFVPGVLFLLGVTGPMSFGAAICLAVALVGLKWTLLYVLDGFYRASLEDKYRRERKRERVRRHPLYNLLREVEWVWGAKERCEYIVSGIAFTAMLVLWFGNALWGISIYFSVSAMLAFFFSKPIACAVGKIPT
jgi:hypothetical protein